MTFENLTVSRICLHEVYPRGEDGNVVPPQYAPGLFQLGGPALATFRSRVLSAFKSDGHSMEMAIRDAADGSAVQIGSSLMESDNEGFVQVSRLFADNLATAQNSQRIPGGLVVVFEGTVGHPAKRYFGVMKAELHEGLQKLDDLQAVFVNNLFLSKGTKLYKIGLFIFDDPDGALNFPQQWTPYLYDQLLTSSRRDGAANYFYSGFLGLNIPENSAHQIRQFFEKTKDFIRSSDAPVELKTDLYNGLYTYLKVDQRPTIQVQQFADDYMPPDMTDNYTNFMRGQKFPTRAIDKDLSEVLGSLRQRRVRFDRRLTLVGPPDAFADLVEIESIHTENGRVATLITIKGGIESQE
ncbi:nucleoid-associated protein [Novosphingobium sp. SL115]|uniref:nucleoid-associated protein n=1 Tax=Novosphingobium sp. SL115 TaxID=2995150 RepID=UPI002272C99F|nr:nucleoid-associated protein [Novosphingobium sp. SL115]MCY1672135.1 nucleoid-associated protein [Novosphingobium sp. SL115]